MTKYYINIGLPDELAQKVVAIERKFQGQGRSEPHLTIIPPRELLGHEGLLVEVLSLTCRQLSAFQIKSVGLGSFDNFQTIMVEIEKSRELVNLYQTLNRAVDGKLARPKVDFSFACPHITLANKLEPKAGVEAWNELKAGEYAWQFRADRINLLRFNEIKQAWDKTNVFDLCWD